MGDTNSADQPGRRVVLAGLGAAGVAAALAGCGSSSSSSTGSNPPASSTGTSGSGSGNGISTKDVPVGGGTVVAAQNIVVTQPTAGQFKAFSATCTHQGCQVSKVENGLIKCPCHNSQYSIADGTVKQAGPGLTPQTQRPLSTKTVSVSGDQITVG